MDFFAVDQEKTYLERISNGDEKAFKELFSYYYPKVKVFLAKLTAASAASDDIAQEIFVKIWLRRETLAHIDNFGAYLYSMTRNAAYDHLKSQKIDISLDDFDAIEDQLIEESLDTDKKRKLVNEIVDKMPKKRRQVFVKSRIEGKSNEQIATEMGLSKKTVENHINLALKMLRKTLITLILFI